MVPTPTFHSNLPISLHLPRLPTLEPHLPAFGYSPPSQHVARLGQLHTAPAGPTTTLLGRRITTPRASRSHDCVSLGRSSFDLDSAHLFFLSSASPKQANDILSSSSCASRTIGLTPRKQKNPPPQSTPRLDGLGAATLLDSPSPATRTTRTTRRRRQPSHPAHKARRAPARMVLRCSPIHGI